MYYRTKKTIIDHLREQATIYIFMIVLFLTGIIFGAVIVNSMNFIQKQELFFYVGTVFPANAGRSGNTESGVI